jgi:hypothetical protein
MLNDPGHLEIRFKVQRRSKVQRRKEHTRQMEAKANEDREGGMDLPERVVSHDFEAGEPNLAWCYGEDYSAYYDHLKATWDETATHSDCHC